MDDSYASAAASRRSSSAYGRDSYDRDNRGRTSSVGRQSQYETRERTSYYDSPSGSGSSRTREDSRIYDAYPVSDTEDNMGALMSSSSRRRGARGPADPHEPPYPRGTNLPPVRHWNRPHTAVTTVYETDTIPAPSNDVLPDFDVPSQQSIERAERQRRRRERPRDDWGQKDPYRFRG
jgi:hypothetical protein